MWILLLFITSYSLWASGEPIDEHNIAVSSPIRVTTLHHDVIHHEGHPLGRCPIPNEIQLRVSAIRDEQVILETEKLFTARNRWDNIRGLSEQAKQITLLLTGVAGGIATIFPMREIVVISPIGIVIAGSFAKLGSLAESRVREQTNAINRVLGLEQVRPISCPYDDSSQESST